MALLINRPAEATNQFEFQNGVEWSRAEQNRLSGELETARERAGLRNEIGVFQVERGDTLGAIAKGLTGTLNWEQRVDYRSQRLPASQRPTTLSEANSIYPGQYVYLNGEILVVSDSLPTVTESPVPSPPPLSVRPVTRVTPVTPVAPTVPLAPASVPLQLAWQPALSPPNTTTLARLPASTSDLVNSVYPGIRPSDRFSRVTFTPRDLPDNIQRFIDLAALSTPQPSTVPVYLSETFDIGSQGAHLSLIETIPNVLGGGVASSDALLLNMSANPMTSLRGTLVGSDAYNSTLINEYSHFTTHRLVLEYVKRRTADMGLLSWPDTDQLKAELIQGFSHPGMPQGLYNFMEYEELMSDAFSFSAYPQELTGRYLIFGQLPVTGFSYDLNRDFVSQYLADFLRTNGYGSYNMTQINQVFRRYYSAFNTGNAAEMTRIERQYHLEDPAFLRFIQPKYQAFGEAFYRHLSTKINAV